MQHLVMRKKEVTDTYNKCNRYSPKTVKSKFGQLTLDIPRDRNGFQPHQHLGEAP